MFIMKLGIGKFNKINNFKFLTESKFDIIHLNMQGRPIKRVIQGNPPRNKFRAFHLNIRRGVQIEALHREEAQE